MSTYKKSVLRHKKKLLKHYRRNQKYTLKNLEVIGEPMEEFCWWALSWGTIQLVADIGSKDAAAMFERWADQVRRGRFGEFDGEQMSKLKDFFGSMIYE